jgi:hypothetical protein
MEEISVLYNNCYGGYIISKKVLTLYNSKMKEMNTDFMPVTDSTNLYYQRHNPVLVEIYNEIGNEFNEKYTDVKIKKIPKIYENHYTITDYDGLEEVVIEYDKYKVDKVKEILRETKTDKEKIEAIELLFKSEQ